MLILALAWACTQTADVADREVVLLEPSAPRAGVAETTLDLPVGSPMGGFTSRCGYLGGDGKPDGRASNYVEAFSPTGGIQTRARAQVLWLEAGGQDFVMVRTDLIYSFDKLVVDLTARLEEATGRDLDGRVVVSTSHTHHSYGNFSDQVGFYLGGDRFHTENYARLLATMEQVAVEAHGALKPAAIGLGVAKDWDPNNDVYRDRRPENDDLQMFDDIPKGSWKDPYLYVLRVDEAGGMPMGVFFFFGMHGTMLDTGNAMISTDAPGHVELALAERFEERIVVAHFQTSGGDASPAGSGDGYARLESVGEYAADKIHDLWMATPTSSEPMTLEAVTHAVPIAADDIHVTRFGAVDWSYLPFEKGRVADDVVYEADGKTLVSPFDEFNAEFGAAFCGSENPLIPAGNIGTKKFPYTTCMDWGLVSRVLLGVFDLTEDEVVLPTPHTMRAMTTAVRIGPLPIRNSDGSEVVDDMLMGFLPGEPVASFGEQYRRYAESELGYDREHAIPVGYSQDHEGYLLPAEDWMLGGYEPNITVWGPLFAEQITEHLIEMSRDYLSTDVVEASDPTGTWAATDYDEKVLPELQVDATPEAGTALDEVPEYLWTPWPKFSKSYAVAVKPPATVARVQGIAQLAWFGGDPAVDLPRVVLETDDGGTWVEVTTRSGRPVQDGPDILLTHTPDPLKPVEDVQTHTWWAAWQAVPHDGDRLSLPIGTYRLHVYGQRFTGTEVTWPRSTEPYEVLSDSFEVVPAAVSVVVTAQGIVGWIQGPSDGFRLIDLEGDLWGANPLPTSAFLTWELGDGSFVDDPTDGTVIEGTTLFATKNWPKGAVRVHVTDAFGNTGSAEL